MAVADELAWEARLPWTHPRSGRDRRWRPSAQPVPERFDIVIPDLLATLTFEPHIGRNPRVRQLARRPHLVSTIYDPVSHLAPVVWEPTLPTGTRRTRRHVWRLPNQSSLDPPNEGMLAAVLLHWAPWLPASTTRRPHRPRATGEVYTLEFRALAAGVTCTELAGGTVTSPGLLTEALTTPDLIGVVVTSPGLIDLEIC
jgi:hypothetical protein